MSSRPEHHPSDTIPTEPLAPIRDGRNVPPWDMIDDGIRPTVLALWAAGYAPVASSAGGQPPGAFVELLSSANRLTSDADRLLRLMMSWFDDGLIHAPGVVTASYEPATGKALVVIAGCKIHHQRGTP